MLVDCNKFEIWMRSHQLSLKLRTWRAVCNYPCFTLLKVGYICLRQNKIFIFVSNLLDEVWDHLEVAVCLQILLEDFFSNESTATENGMKTQHQSSLLIEKQMLKNVFDVKILNPNPHAEAVPKAI